MIEPLDYIYSSLLFCSALFLMRTFPSYPSDPDETPRRRWSSKPATIGRNVSRCKEIDVSPLHDHSILWVKEVQGIHIEKIHVAEIA